MKRIILILVGLFLFSYLNAELQSINGMKLSKPIDISNYYTHIQKDNIRDNRQTPDWEFITYPTELMTSYYDYMPGGYNSYPLRLRTVDGNDIFLIFQARPTSTSAREIYWVYIYEDGTIDGPHSWGEGGFCTIVIHSASGNVIYTHHSDNGIVLYYEDFIWNPFPPPPLIIGGGYLWPYLYIGPSPIEGKVRVFLLSSSLSLCQEVRIMYIDIDEDANVNMYELLDINNWSEVFVFTDWNDYDIRVFQSFATDYSSPGKVAFIGYAAWLSGDLGNMPVEEGVFVWESFDYGETWDYANLHSDGPTDYIYQVENIPGFTHNGELIDTLYASVIGWHNTALFDSEQNLHLTYLQEYGFTDSTGSYYFSHFLPQAEVVWDGSNFTFNEVPKMPGIDPLSGHSVPWYIEYDPFSGLPIDTVLVTVVGWSLYENELFHENTQKQAVNIQNNWMIQVWADGTYVQLAQDGDPEYQEYLEHPIIYVSASNDNGEHWSEPIELTDIFDEYGNPTQFYDQITVYPYICDQIVDLGDGWGQVYMYYFDDNTFGSTVIQNQPPDDGGQITYCSFKINFEDIEAIDDEQEMPSTKIRLYNYPNPFSTSTTISFNLVTDKHKEMRINIYNIKGELIKQLSMLSSQSSINWDGKDDNGNVVSNGVYLIRAESDKYNIVKKLVKLE